MNSLVRSDNHFLVKQTKRLDHRKLHLENDQHEEVHNQLDAFHCEDQRGNKIHFSLIFIYG